MSFEKALFVTSVILALVLFGRTAMADSIQGSAELTKSTSKYELTDATGLSTTSRSDVFSQRYRLSFDDRLYPFLGLQAGVRFDQSQAESGGIPSKTTNILPMAALTLRNPFVSAGVSYDERIQKQEVSGTALPTNFRQNENAFLGFKPEGLPTLDILFARMHLYDEARLLTDSVTRTVSLGSRYSPVKTLDLSVKTAHSDVQNRIQATEYQQATQTGRAAYSDRYFSNSALLSATYTMNREDTTFIATGNDAIRFQVYPFAGLSDINDTPTLGALVSNVALIDGNTTASTGLNIGQLPSLEGDARQRSAGLDLGVETELNSLFIWVDRDVPSTVVASFSWDIYISTDNQNWNLYQTVFPATFGLFDNRFEIAVNNVKTRYIKVLTRPLSLSVLIPPDVDVSNIYLTEIQAFLDTPASQVEKEKSTTTQAADLNFRMHFIRTERRAVYYDLYYKNSVRTGQSANVVLTNALSAQEQFSKVLSGTARITRENRSNGDERKYYTMYDVSLLAAGDSLPKLNHSLMLTSNRSDSGGKTSDASSVTLSNTAEVYPGIDASLIGSENIATSLEGRHSTGSSINFEAGLRPHRAVSINMNQADTRSTQSGADRERVDTHSWSRSVSVSYNPISSLYLVGSVTIFSTNNQPRRTFRNFGASWAVQQSGGSLQISLVYNELAQYEDQDTRTRVIMPSARWKINRRAYFDVAYALTTIESYSTQQTTDTRNITTTFKMYL